MTELIAERVFDRRDGLGPVTVRMFAPKKDEDWIGWSARVEILGLVAPFQKEQPGSDAFQALYLALMTVCRELEKIESTLTFRGSNAGLPIIMPWDGDVSLKRDVYSFIIDKLLGAAKTDGAV